MPKNRFSRQFVSLTRESAFEILCTACSKSGNGMARNGAGKQLMLSRYDQIVIAFYFVFMTVLSWVMKRFIRNTSDYFRAGGEMLWWMAGSGAFMVSFSAVTFTGMAGKSYTDGPVPLIIFIGNA